jgi:Sec-independent protein translocase protein TatA
VPNETSLLMGNLVLLIINITILLFALHKLTKSMKAFAAFMRDLRNFLEREMHSHAVDSPDSKTP